MTDTMAKIKTPKNADVALLCKLSLGFGPSGCEDEIRDIILDEIRPLGLSYRIDRLGNLIVSMRFGQEEKKKKLMISAHMDEVGFMVAEITDGGYLHFDPVGGIEGAVLSGRKVTFRGDTETLRGVIHSKAIHLKSADERKKAPSAEKLIVDVGAKNGDDVKRVLSVGDFGTFDSEFFLFGKDERMVKGKALDDRMGCCAMIEVMRALSENPPAVNLEIFFCFTTREEIGLSGAQTAAQSLMPDYALVLETTAIGDVADVKASLRVADVGKGGVVSLMDRSTVYPRLMTDFLLQTSKRFDVPVQVKRYVSGGNDAGHIHKSGIGVRTAALSVPTRYLHSPACVASLDDYEAVRDLTEAVIRNFDALSEVTA